MTTASPVTARELERLSFPGKRVALVRGRVIVREPPGTWHGLGAANATCHVRVKPFLPLADVLTLPS